MFLLLVLLSFQIRMEENMDDNEVESYTHDSENIYQDSSKLTSYSILYQ